MRTSAATTTGSNCVPAQRSSSATASSTARARLYGRSLAMAWKASQQQTILDGRGIDAETTVQADKLSLAVEQETDVDAVILDAQDGVAQALVSANAARALRPDVPILIVGETEASERAPLGARVYDKWDETDELLAALEQILDEHQVDPLTPPLLGYDA